MGTWHEYLNAEGTPPEWPYPIKFGEEREIEADVVVLGGGTVEAALPRDEAIAVSPTLQKLIAAEAGKGDNT